MNKKITLSFDNGPHPINTVRTLKILKDFQVKTSFFCIGDNLKDPDNLRVLDEIASQGHIIGSHTMTHSIQLGNVKEESILDYEITQAHRLLGEFGLEKKWFRPYGNFGLLDKNLFNQQALNYLKQHSFSTVIWNCIPQDWIYEDTWDVIALKMITQLDHSVIVLHDFLDRGMERLTHFLETVLNAGWKIEQAFPQDCIVTDAGSINPGFDHLINEGLALEESALRTIRLKNNQP